MPNASIGSRRARVVSVASALSGVIQSTESGRTAVLRRGLVDRAASLGETEEDVEVVVETEAKAEAEAVTVAAADEV